MGNFPNEKRGWGEVGRAGGRGSGKEVNGIFLMPPEICGTGKSWLEGGEVYCGAWQEGERHGQGRCSFSTGDEYEGLWQRGKRHGSGRCVYASGDVYDGKRALMPVPPLPPRPSPALL